MPDNDEKKETGGENTEINKNTSAKSSQKAADNNAPEIAPSTENKKVKKKKTLFRRIVNSFLYLFLGLAAIILLLLGFTQTSTFRNILREKVMAIADSSINGHVYIGNIEGTIFTSLILTNTTISMGTDTLLNAGRIEVRTAPLQLLFKKIYVRKILISNTNVKLVKDSLGILNISKLIPPKKTVDTSKSAFPFTISAPDIRLSNVSFSIQDYNKVKSTEIYNSLSLSDFRIRNINTSLSAFANIDKNEYELTLNELSLSPNLSNFNLKELSAKILLNPKEINLKGLKFYTNNSNIQGNLSVMNFNLFDSTSDFRKANFNIHLLANKFDFLDLKSFLPSLTYLQGKLFTKIDAEGSVKNLQINNLEIEFGNSLLKTKGEIKNLLAGSSMIINAELNGSHIYQPDIIGLLPELKFPLYNDYGILRFDQLTFDGTPLNFKTLLDLKTDKGNISASIGLNFEPAIMIYDLEFKTSSFDFSPFTGMQTLLTSTGSIKGQGTNAGNLNAKIILNSSGAFRGLNIKSIDFTATANNKLIDFNINLLKDAAAIQLNGNLNFTNPHSTSYNFVGNAKNIVVEDFIKDSSLQTNLNFQIQAEGKNFNPDSLELYSTIFMNNSIINGKTLDSTRAIIDIRNLENNGGRLVNIISDIADITITGHYKIDQLTGLLSKESSLVTSIVKEKINKIYPLSKDSSITKIIKKEDLPILKKNSKAPVPGIIDLKYLIELKDFSLASLFIGSEKHLEIDGQMQGTLRNNGDSLSFTYSTKLGYLKYWAAKDVFFISKFNLNFRLNNLLTAGSLDNIFSNLNVKAERIYTGTDIKNFNFNIRLNGDSSKLRMAAQIENYASARLNGNFRLADNTINILLDTLNIKYQKISLTNKDKIDITYSKDNINFNKFIIGNEAGNINLRGIYSQNGNNDLQVKVTDLDLGVLSRNVLQLNPDSYVDGKFNLETKLTGQASSPVIKMGASIDNIVYKEHKFGSFFTTADYSSGLLTTDSRFIDSSINKTRPALLVTSSLPLNLSLSGSSELMPKEKQVRIEMVADSFNLAALGNLVPQIKRLKGLFSANLKISGTYGNLIPDGYVKLQDGGFLVEANNMEYLAGFTAKLNDNSLIIDNLVIQNTKESKGGGTITINGQAGMNGLVMQSSDFKVSGTLKILDQASKKGSLGVYGDLVIGTKGNIELTVKDNVSYLKAPIVIKTANVTIPPSPTAYKNTNSAFIYKYAQDTSTHAPKIVEFDSLVQMAKGQSSSSPTKVSSKKNSLFNYVIDLSIENEATAHFVLSKELNQAMTAVLKGNITYQSINGKEDTQGELTLLEGSTLEFLKTFSAAGSITFEGNIRNPYLDIIATYQGYYYSSDSSSSSNETQVAVKLKIKGPVSELEQSFINKQNNFAVYYGINNINNDVIDHSKDASDALMFIVTNKFTADLTQSEKSAATGQLSSTATSLAGSVLGGFINRYAGDYVKTVELRQVGTATKFNLSGRVKKFRYTIGGSTQVFQDLSQANIRIEYPILEELLFRIERKESFNETGTINEMINELGLKYKFEF